MSLKYLVTTFLHTHNPLHTIIVAMAMGIPTTFALLLVILLEVD